MILVGELHAEVLLVGRERGSLDITSRHKDYS